MKKKWLRPMLTGLIRTEQPTGVLYTCKSIDYSTTDSGPIAALYVCYGNWAPGMSGLVKFCSGPCAANDPS